jgi:hypothetical protein
MKLDKNGKLPRFYQWSYSEKDLPDNFCSYFWHVLWAIILFPVTWLSYPLPNYPPPPIGIRFIIGIVGYFLLGLLAGLVYALLVNPFQTLKIAGTIVGAIGALSATIFGFIYIKERLDGSDEKSVFTEIAEIVREKKKSVKENYCPKINWRV